MTRRWTCARWPAAAWCSGLALAALTAAGCGGGGTGSDTTSTSTPNLRAGEPCPVSPGRNLARLGAALGSGPAYPAGGFRRDAVLEMAPPGNFSSHLWGGEKVLWVQAPGAPRGLVVTGRRLDAPGQVRFNDGDLPPARMALPAPDPKAWVDRPSYTRLAAPGCYAYEVAGPATSEVVVFRAVRLAHWYKQGERVEGRSAQAMERAIVEPTDERTLAVPFAAACRAPTPAELRHDPFGHSQRVFSCAISDDRGSGRYDVQFLSNGCYDAALQRKPGQHSRGIEACHRPTAR